MDSNNEELSYYQNYAFSDLLNLFWEKKVFILILSSIFAVSSVIFALSIPDKYTSYTLVMPKESQSQNSSMTSGLGNIARLTGVPIQNNETDKSRLGIEILKSRNFVSNFINNRDIKIDLMASNGWNRKENILNYDSRLFDQNTKNWINVNKKDSKEPTLQEAYKFWMESVFEINKDKATGFITISIKHFSPVISQRWSNWLIEDINNVMREKDLEEASKSLDFLNQKVLLNNNQDMQNLLYVLIQKEMETEMMAYANDDYVFSVIDPAIIPEVKSEPSRSLICFIITLIGFLASLVIVMIKDIYFPNSKQSY